MWTSRVIVQADQEMGTAQPFVGEDVKVLPVLLYWTRRQVLVNPDKVVDPRLEAKTVRVRAVIAVIHARIAFGRENVGVAEQLVEDDLVGSAEIGVVVLDERDSLER